MDITYSIAPAIFEKFPAFLRGVVVARGVANRPSPAELVDMLRAEEQALRTRMNAETLAAHPLLAAWREAFRTLGIKAGEYRPSIEALARRVLNGHDLPSINALVDIGNTVSLRHLLPTGGHALDNVQGDITLRPARGDEEFVPFGGGAAEQPEPGEFIFAEGAHVLTRRWVWRQSAHTLTDLDTTLIEFNIDALPPAGAAAVQAAADDLMALTARFCGGKAEAYVLSREQPMMMIEP
jgi:DNA/RNA-binding domain of Phe-tRNA-synthetase-like protein